MARLPSLALEERPSPRPSGAIGTLPAESGLEMKPAQITMESGQQISNTGEKMLEAQLHEQRILDAEARAEAKRQAAEARAEAKRLQLEAQRTAGIKAYTDFGNDVADLSQTITQGIQTGTIKPNDGVTQYDQAVKILQDKYSKDNDPLVLEPVRIHMDNAARDARRQLLGTVEGQRRQEVLSNFVGTREGLERRAINDLDGAHGAYKAVAEEVLRSAGVDQAKIAADIQGFNERTTFNFLQRQVNAASNNPAALKTLQSVLGDTKQYDALDADKRRVLLNQVENRQEVLRMRAQHEADRRENAAGRAITQYINLSLAGQNPDAGALADLQAQVRGTSYAPQFRAITQTLEANQKFGQLPPTEMAKLIEEDAAKISKGYSSPEAAQALQLQIQRRSQMLKNVMTELDKDPHGYLNRTAGVDPGTIDWSKPEAAAAVLKQRQSNLSTLAQTHPARQGVFRPVELDEFQQRLAGMPARDRAAALGVLAGTLGPTSAAYRDTMLQLAPKSPVTAFAGEMMVKKPDVAERMLRGEDILHPGKAEGRGGQFKIGKEEDFNQAFNSATGKLFGAGDEDLRQTYYQATKAVYATMSQDAYDYTDVVDGGRVKKAFEMVTGGVVRWNGKNVLPPIGMSAPEFRASVNDHFAAAAAAGRVAVQPGYINDANLVKLQGPRYGVQNGSSILRDEKTGRPFVLDLGEQLPEVPKPTRLRPARTREDQAATFGDVMRGRPR